MSIFFGAGKLIATPLKDSLGNDIANPTPVILGAMQDVTLDTSVEIKKLHGTGRYPLAVGQGKANIGIKAKYADINGGVLGGLFYGKTPTSSIKAAAFDVAGTVPASIAYTVTPTVPNSGTWVADMGVFNSTTGAQYTRVASAPTAGQYSVTNGVYTFASADASANMQFSFEYSATSTTAKLFNITNDAMGYTPSFSIILQASYEGKTLVAKLNKAVSSKFNLPFKNDDFVMSDFEADCFADAANNIGYICLF